MIQITQGDTPTLTITCQTGNGGPFNISAGSFSTKILGPTSVVTFGNAKHTIIDAPNGVVSVALAASDSAGLAIGKHEIVTTITQGSVVTSFHGPGACEVLSTNPSH